MANALIKFIYNRIDLRDPHGLISNFYNLQITFIFVHFSTSLDFNHLIKILRTNDLIGTIYVKAKKLTGI